MRNNWLLSCLTIAVLMATSPCDSAYALPVWQMPLAPKEKSQRLEGGRFTIAPFAHVLFCKANPSECNGTQPNYERHIDDLALVKTINEEVNDAIIPQMEIGTGTKADVWKIFPLAGDCDDYVVSKRSRLIAAGWEPRNLRIAVAFTRSGQGHAVLVVSTKGGDYVLDNRTNRIVLWHKTDLHFIKIQDRDRPKLWRAL